MKGRRLHGGFSLLELMIVIGLIAVLVAILLPVIGKARRSARSTQCLSHLNEWGQAFQAYVSAHGRGMAQRDTATMNQWWEELGVFTGNTNALLLCPEASEPGNGPIEKGSHSLRSGSAHLAWSISTYNVGAPEWVVRGNYVGSYCYNDWASYGTWNPNGLRFPASRNAENIPLFADGVVPHESVLGNDPPHNLQGSGLATDMGVYCIDRHDGAVNVSFADGHARQVRLPNLWMLKWREAYQPRNVVLPKE